MTLKNVIPFDRNPLWLLPSRCRGSPTLPAFNFSQIAA
jgi:hypothetical protein